jgi:hypothetical protein
MNFFGSHSGNFFLSESSIVALYSNLFESGMKNGNLYFNLSNPKKIKYQKDKSSNQSGLYKGWYIQYHSVNYPKKYHYGRFSSCGITIKHVYFLPPHIEIP